MSTETEKNSVEALLAAGKALAQSIQIKGFEDVLVVPDGWKPTAAFELVKNLLPTPARTKAEIRLQDPESFIDYVNEHKDENASRIFLRVGAPTEVVFGAVIDMFTASTPAWCQHTAILKLVPTEEWTRFINGVNKPLSQGDFAEFLEENQDSITEPAGASLLELVQNLSGRNNISYDSATRLANGKMKIAYSEDVQLTRKGETEEFPEKIVAVIAPFEGAPQYKFSCRIRYRIQERKLLFTIRPVDIHLVYKDTINKLSDRIAEKTGLPVYRGVLKTNQ